MDKSDEIIRELKMIQNFEAKLLEKFDELIKLLKEGKCHTQ